MGGTGCYSLPTDFRTGKQLCQVTLKGSRQLVHRPGARIYCTGLNLMNRVTGQLSTFSEVT